MSCSLKQGHCAIVFLSLALCLSTRAATLSDEDRTKAVDTLFAEFHRPGSPGMAVGIQRGGKLIYAQGYGMADLEHPTLITPDTIFHVASVSKQFTAFAIALLAREGKVDLDADIRNYLSYVPEFGHTITVNHLIHHSSGLRDQWALFALGGLELGSRLRQEQVVNMVKRQRALNFEPGSEHAYSNTGYTLLAEIVHAVSGKTLREFTAERIFEPLGMDRTLFFDDVTRIVPGRANSYTQDSDDDENGNGEWRRSLLNFDNVGATSLFTTVRDLLKWSHNFSQPTVGDAVLVEQVMTAGTLNDGSPIKYAFGLTESYYAGHRAVRHGGSDAGFRSLFAYFPDEDFAVVILANRPADLARPMEDIVEIYLGRKELPVHIGIPERTKPDRKIISALVGRYLPPYGRLITLVEANGELGWTTAGWPLEPLVIRVDGSFDIERYRDQGFYRPARDGAGRITGIEEVSGGRKSQVFPRVDSWQPSDAELQQFAGDFYSPELDVTYSFRVAEDRLVGETVWSSEPVSFEPVVPDRFDSDVWNMGTIHFERDGDGRVIAFVVHTRRIRHVRFEKVDRG